MPTRRRFLETSIIAGVGVLAPWPAGWSPVRSRTSFGPTASAAPGVQKFTESLPWLLDPALVIDARAGGRFRLPIAPGLHRFHAGLPLTPTWGYGGASYLGPTFEAKRGAPIDVTWTNDLTSGHLLPSAVDTTLHGPDGANDRAAPRLSVHLHGGNTEPGSDGHPELTFTPRHQFAYHYHNNQEAATLWYHDHALGITRLNVYAGLAGFYLLRDTFDTGRADNSLGLPSGHYEIPLVIQDKRFHFDGRLDYPTASNTGAGPLVPPIWIPEFFGDTAVINGKLWPNLLVQRGLYRFRMLNGSNARFYNLRFRSEGTSAPQLYQIGTDGGLLNAPVAIGAQEGLLLGPGERADVLLDFSRCQAGGKIVVTNDAVAPFPAGPHGRHPGGDALSELLQITVGDQEGFTGPIPGMLRGGPSRPASIPGLPGPVRIRNLALIEVLDPATGVPVKALLNNLPWHTAQIETPTVNTVEQWNIINTTGDAHPIHLHLVQFLIQSRQRFNTRAYLTAFNAGLPAPGLPDPSSMEQGPWTAQSGALSADPYTMGGTAAPNPNERGWKDTVRAMPGEVTRLLVPFGAGAAPNLAIGQSFTGAYVWHCHILEHEDNEMMLPYRVST